MRLALRSRTVQVREFRANLASNLKNLPVIIYRRKVPVATVTSYEDKKENRKR